MKNTRCKGVGKTGQCARWSSKRSEYCQWHDPKRPAEPRKERTQHSSLLQAARRTIMLEDSLAAVRKIAAGHADPMALCKNILTQFDRGEP